MKEKILALLVAKFAGVRKDGLARLAQSLALQAENDTEAGALVEKLTTEKVNEFVTDYRKDVDKEVSDSNKTFETNLKKKFDLVEKKDPQKNTDPDPTKGTDPTDIAAIVANAIKAAVEPLQKEMASFKGEKVNETRLQQLESKFAGVPDSYKNQRISDAKMFIGTMDETAFAEYLTRTDADITAFNQELADKGMAGHGKPLLGQKNNEGVSSGVASFIASKTTDKAKAMTGKEI